MSDDEPARVVVAEDVAALPIAEVPDVVVDPPTVPHGTFGSKLFLSCDLVGSTSHKQTVGNAFNWIPHFLDFYYRFPALVRQHLRLPELANKLSFWKAVGDELLYVADVTTEAEIDCIVSAWLFAMEQYEDELEERNRKANYSSGPTDPDEAATQVVANKMKTKGGAFIATFPAPDFEVAVPLQPEELRNAEVWVQNRRLMQPDRRGERLIDYLGPSIDTGFRIIHQASQRFFTMSMEVVWAMAHHRLHGPNPRQQTFEGLTRLEEVAMKGVWGGREYPVFAIDRLVVAQQPDPVVAALAEVRQTAAVGTMQICVLGEACHRDQSWPSRIYLAGSAEPSFTSWRPELQKAQDFYEDLTDRSGESRAPVEPDDEPGGRDPDAMQIEIPASDPSH